MPLNDPPDPCVTEDLINTIQSSCTYDSEHELFLIESTSYVLALERAAASRSSVQWALVEYGSSDPNPQFMVGAVAAGALLGGELQRDGSILYDDVYYWIRAAGGGEPIAVAETV